MDFAYIHFLIWHTFSSNLFSISVLYNILITMFLGMLFPPTSCFPMRETEMRVRTRRSSRTSQEQWKSPCGPGHHISSPLGQVIVPQSQDLLEHFEDIWSKAQETKQETAALKRLFVSILFGIFSKILSFRFYRFCKVLLLLSIYHVAAVY